MTEDEISALRRVICDAFSLLCDASMALPKRHWSVVEYNLHRSIDLLERAIRSMEEK